MEMVSENTCFGGVQGVYKHQSAVTNCEMAFAVYLPPMMSSEKVPVLWYLSGLTCTHENAMTKAMAQAFAAEQGIALVFPDTSPRGEGVANDESYDLGQGAGFYLDATEDPWKPHFQMSSYITRELQAVVAENFPIDPDRQGITGHSMGGHGAITLALNNPGIYRSLSAFAPIANPSASDWGRKQLTAYLGSDEAAWAKHDATLLVQQVGWKGDMLIDQGVADEFLHLLKPEALASALTENRIAHVFRMQEGYDHSYFFVASFIEDHIRWHTERL
ncbi:S-formylglutathione hydrolase [Rhodobacteraceae bacterium NNCM2]|nr:S-formylglutathione hydrolase [Coraliihabitans acroporae]